MAKAPASDAIMTPDKMKPLLALSKREPVSAAIGLTTDGEGLILLHKKAKPKKVLSMLRTEAGKAKLQLSAASMRFGRAEVDTDYDSGMVRFFINKDAPGNMRVKLVEVVKRIPYQKVEINVDPSLELESEEDEGGAQDQAAPTPVADSAPQAAAPAPAAAAAPMADAPSTAPDAALAALRAELVQLIPQIGPAAGADVERGRAMKMDAQQANEDIKKGNIAGATEALARLKGLLASAAPSTGAPDASALTAELATLMRRIPEAVGADPGIKAQLMKLATDANASLKAREFTQASDVIAQLREVLHNAPNAAGAGIAQVTPAAEPTTPTATGKRKSGDELLALFRDAKDEVDAGLNKLRTALLDTGDIDLAQIADYGLYGMTDGGGVGLMKALFNLRGASPDTREAFTKAARDAAAAYKAAVFADRAVDLVDQNPFGVDVGIRAKLGAALDEIAQAA